MPDTDADVPEEWTPDRPLYCYTDEDLSDILGDVFVEAREIVGDDRAAKLVDIAYERLTDDFYTEQATDE